MDWTFASVVAAVIAVPAVFTFIIFIHEFGHFAIARRCGVFVKIFSIGFGRELFGWYDSKGTRWKVSALPLGGYVQFLGDANAASAPDADELERLSESDKQRTLQAQKLWKRIAIVLAGPLTNVLFALVIFTMFHMFLGVYEGTPVAREIRPGFPAEKAGFLVGDEFLRVNGDEITSASDIKRALNLSPNEPVTFVVRRDGREKEIPVTPVSIIDQTVIGKQRDLQMGIVVGYVQDSLRIKYYGPVEAFEMAALQCWGIVEGSARAIYLVIANELPPDTVSGGIRMAEAVARAGGTMNLLFLIHITALFSLSVGVINLLPIPVLDGGHLLFFLIEGVIGHPVNDKIQEIAFRIGFAIIILLTASVLSMDAWFKVIHG
jgi:regulator of sigma E protease